MSKYYMSKYCCSECGKTIEGRYFMALDNFLQVRYFDADSENMFCSEECFCKYCMLEECEVVGDKE